MKLTRTGMFLLPMLGLTIALSFVSDTAAMIAAGVLALALLGALGGLHGGPRRRFADDPAVRDPMARSLDRHYFVNP